VTPSLDLLVSLLREGDVSFSQILPLLLDRMQDDEPLSYECGIKEPVLRPGPFRTQLPDLASNM
jgi:hypothetical protein